ncbi:MAG: ester cyclase [Acidimicrobiia bacterium]|nr:ester cyclase [Acidimicrobiia bacterium]
MNHGAGDHGEPIDPDVLEAFSRRYFDAWNSRSAPNVAACATTDVVWDSPALPKPGIGRQAVVGLVQATAVAFPDYEFTAPSPWAISHDRLTAYVPWRMTGTNTGSFDPPGFAPTGRSIDLSGIDVWQFRNGLIWRYQAVYNYSEIARQLGLSPQRDGTIERVAVRAQRVFVSMSRARRRIHGLTR